MCAQCVLRKISIIVCGIVSPCQSIKCHFGQCKIPRPMHLLYSLKAHIEFAFVLHVGATMTVSRSKRAVGDEIETPKAPRKRRM